MQHKRVRVQARVEVQVWVDVDIDAHQIEFHGGEVKAFEAAIERAVNGSVGFEEDSRNTVGNVTDVFVEQWDEE